jgi:hypothetical protein
MTNCHSTLDFVFTMYTMNFQEIMKIRSVYLPLPNTHPLIENVIFNYIVNEKKILH